jgi:sugar transferase (PEP-CTERM/EpsH1 system associated)
MRIFFITSRFPFPLEKGDKLRAYELIRHLSTHHEIYLFALNEGPVEATWEEELRPYCEEIQYFSLTKMQHFKGLLRSLFNGRPFSTEYFYDHAVKAKVNELLDRLQVDLIFCHLIRSAEYVRHRSEIKVLDYMDVFSKGMARRAEVEKGPVRVLAGKEYRRLQKYEEDVFSDFQAHCIISSQDRDLIPHPDNQKIHVLPNGVDMEFYAPKPGSKHYDLLFAGNMAYPPNVQAVKFLVENVMPLVWELRPETNVCIAGADPAPALKKYRSELIEITGWVDDIRGCFWESKVMVAPMQISIGLQNKILQGMSMEMPCLVSNLANNAVGGHHGIHLMEAEKADEYAQAIIRLLDDEKISKELGQNARQFIEENYHWDILVGRFNRNVLEPLRASDDH